MIMIIINIYFKYFLLILSNIEFHIFVATKAIKVEDAYQYMAESYPDKFMVCKILTKI